MDASNPPPPPGSQVKLRSASLINYILNLTGAVFSLFFITLLTRRLAVEDWANWVMITRYLAYIAVPAIVYTYWTTRDISRGKNDSKTALNLSVGMGLAFMPIYVILMLIFSANFEQPLMPLLVSTAIVFFDFLNAALNAISSGHAPQFTGYGSFSLKVTQAVFGYFLVGFAAMGLTGAVIAALVGRIVTDCVLLIMNRKVLRQSRFSLDTIKSWLRSSWLPLFLTFASMIYTLDVLVVRISYGSEVPIAYYGVALNLLTAVLFANVVTYTFYPKVLSKKNLEDLNEALWLILLLSIPIATLMILYAKPLIAIFGIQYVPAAGTLQLLVVYSVVQVIVNLLNSAYIGLERVDENGLLSSKGLMRSALFKSGLISLSTNITYLTVLSIVLAFQLDIVGTTSAWALLLLAIMLFVLCCYIFLLKRDFSQTFPYKEFLSSLSKFIVAAIPASIPLFFIKIELSEGFTQMVTNMILPVIVSTLLYSVTLFIIDRKFRKTIGQVLQKIHIGF